MESDSGWRRNSFLNAGIFFWALMLLAWCFERAPLAIVCLILLPLSFVIHFQQKRIIAMFGKKTENNKNEMSLLMTHEPQAVEMHQDSKASAGTEKPVNTVVAGNSRFDGNLSASGQIYVYGSVYGNIDAAEGLVKVMRNGMVEGNIHAREIIIDGHVKGHCQAEIIDIHDNGHVDGTMAYAQLSIKKGGIFVGQADYKQSNETIKVIALKNDKSTPVIEDVSPHSEKKSG
ncbi:polymer-forming cytoskeletal protein [Enterobacteriaceae bacterium C23F]